MSVVAQSAHPLACLWLDLDGTLLDTAPDLARALNRLRRERGQPLLPFSNIRPLVSEGAVGLLRIGVGIAETDAEFEALRQRFLSYYEADIATATTLFPGMTAVLAHLEAHGLRWGIVTNKPAALTEPLLKALHLWNRAACVVSGDTLPVRKPHPEPLLYACRRIGVAPARCLYIGDTQRDIEAGRRAGMRTLVARYGYLQPSDRPEQWGADGMIDKPQDLLGWIGLV